MPSKVRLFLEFFDAAMAMKLTGVSGYNILVLFAAAHGLTDEQTRALRNVLEAKGIL